MPDAPQSPLEDTRLKLIALGGEFIRALAQDVGEAGYWREQYDRLRQDQAQLHAQINGLCQTVDNLKPVAQAALALFQALRDSQIWQKDPTVWDLGQALEQAALIPHSQATPISGNLPDWPEQRER